MTPEHTVDGRLPVRCRSLLNTPALDTNRFAKAAHAGADVGIVDLEDSVAQSAKAAAREITVRYLASPREGTALRAVRINAVRSVDGLRDLLALIDGGARPDLILVPKAESPEDLRLIDAILEQSLPDTGLLALIETAQGVANVDEIAVATPRLRGLVFGGADLSARLGVSGTWESHLYARSRIAMAAALGGLQAIDTPFFDLKDAQGLAREIRMARALGFCGKVAIHPDQLNPIHEGFAPSAQEVAHAQAVVERAASAGGREIYVVQGAMVGPPLLTVARRVLELARPSAGSPPGASPRGAGEPPATGSEET